MNDIVIVDGAFAIMRDDKVIGVVERCPGEPTKWGFYPFGANGIQYVPLHHALQEGQKFNPWPTSPTQGGS